MCLLLIRPLPPHSLCLSSTASDTITYWDLCSFTLFAHIIGAKFKHWCDSLNRFLSIRSHPSYILPAPHRPHSNFHFPLTICVSLSPSPLSLSLDDFSELHASHLISFTDTHSHCSPRKWNWLPFWICVYCRQSRFWLFYFLNAIFISIKSLRSKLIVSHVYVCVCVCCVYICNVRICHMRLSK